MIDPRAFWGTDSDRNPPLTSAMIAEIESAFRLRLPARYLELLRIQNGGYTRGFVFATYQRTSWAEEHVPVSELAGIDPRISLPIGLHNLWNTEYMTREWGLPPRQLLLAGDGHWWISLDYRQRNDPEVWWLDTAIDDGLRLAPNFDDFLSGLRPESDVDPERGVLSPGRLA